MEEHILYFHVCYLHLRSPISTHARLIFTETCIGLCAIVSGISHNTWIKFVETLEMFPKKEVSFRRLHWSRRKLFPQ